MHGWEKQNQFNGINEKYSSKMEPQTTLTVSLK